MNSSIFIGRGFWIFVSFLMACSTPERRGVSLKEGEAPTATISRPKDLQGLASWYGRRHHRKRTANGERFNMYAFTAAHRTLPFGSKVRVTNLNNGKSVEVRVNDRGPVSRKRLIDLSYAAGRSLGIVGPGVAPVRLEVLKGLNSRYVSRSLD